MQENNLNDKRITEFIEYLLRISYNQKCADCGNLKPTWASLNFSFFICYECAAKHRSLGVYITKVKNTQLDKWNIEELRRMYVGGNKNAHKISNDSDFSAKYKNSSDLIKEIDKLVEESIEKEPGDSFMKIDKTNSYNSFGKSVIKKKSMRKLNESPIIANTAEIKPILNEEVIKKSPEIKKETPKTEFIKKDKILERKITETEKLKKSLNSSRSPFSFGRKNDEDYESDS